MRISRKNRDYFGNLNSKIVADNRKFWKAISLLFSAFHRERITIKESNKTITNNEELAETFNNIFISEIVPSLNIGNNLGNNITKPHITDQFSVQSKSILKIKEMMGKKPIIFF